ncbi:TrkH family potassium uptake protein [Rhodobium gokarnense]|uniref:Trk system potassium uptake protein n=1 Tax=Rhodobium gokarnense TaxID=364296 RepID=A0ABT3HCN2_9HYPH|nr:TrkH family potassium uptake protein [Rhodobium gokarnense]MCW2308163.1 trk system potassium uptake protein TrkH [Rhodobium gokarnense]
MNVRPIFFILGFLYFGLATAMIVPAIVDVAVGNPDWIAFVASALFTGAIGLLLALSFHRELVEGLSIRQAFLLTTLAWTTLPAFGALPFLGLGISYADAAFEAVSGITTTGSTVLDHLEQQPPGLLLWRSILQWLGGIGIIVMAIVLLPYLRVGGMQLFQTESSDRSEKIVPRAGDFVRLLAGVYLLLTALCALAYRASEMTWFDAINHAMTTLSTGGFSTHDASFGYFTEPATAWFAVLFMFLGGVPFTLIIQAVRGRPLALWRDPQVITLFRFLVIVSLFGALFLVFTHRFELLDALLMAAFNFTSVVTTTGFSYQDYTLWGAPIVGTVFMLTFVGGCTGSTGGGIKIFRFIVFAGTLRHHLRVMVRPHRVVSEHYNNVRLTPDIVTSVLAFLVAYLGLVGVFTVILTLLHLDLVTALTGAAQAIGNVGPGLGDVIGPSGNFAPLSDGAKWVLSAAMLMGRLELFTVLVIFDPEFWSN